MAHLHSENERKHFLGWNDPVPSSIANKWKRFRVNLEDISKIRIPRSVRYTPDLRNDIRFLLRVHSRLRSGGLHAHTPTGFIIFYHSHYCKIQNLSNKTPHDSEDRVMRRCTGNQTN